MIKKLYQQVRTRLFGPDVVITKETYQRARANIKKELGFDIEDIFKSIDFEAILKEKDIVKNKSEVSNYFFLKERFGVYRTNKIIKIDHLGDKLPQRIEGLVIDTETGIQEYTSGLDSSGLPINSDLPINSNLRPRTSNLHVFACEIEKRVTPEELNEIKKKLIKRILDF